jgi:hypothetical protein
MHNCKETREIFTELLLDGMDFRSDQAISAELSRCSECRSEFEAMSATLRLANRLGETAAPAEDYWTGYHSKLRQRLVSAQTESSTSRAKAQRHKEELGPLFEPLRPRAGTSVFARFLKTSIPVPLPLALALVVIAALFLTLALPFARKDVQQPNTTTIVRVPVEVPVVQEKPVIQERIVTRVVYRDRLVVRATKRATQASQAESTFAKSQRSQVEVMPAGLAGFKPSDEVKLTVIKGGVPNEK